MVVILVFFVLLTSYCLCFSLQNDTQYCVGEDFHAECFPGEFILMNSAKYGYMGRGRCYDVESDIDCVVDALPYIDKECSWKERCNYPVGHIEQHVSRKCFRQLRPYLMATYSCISVESSQNCQPHTDNLIESTGGLLATSIAKITKCGSVSSPWRIRSMAGQSVSLYIHEYTMRQLTDDDCPTIGYFTGSVSKKNITLCPFKHSNPLIYTFNGEDAIVQLLANAESEDHFILEYKVSGCVDLNTPEHAWYSRTGDLAMIGCEYRNMTWQLHCVDNRWQGVVGRCHKPITGDTTEEKKKLESQKDYTFMILICVAAIMFTLLLMLSTIGIIKLIDKHKRKQCDQLLMKSLDGTATCYRYGHAPHQNHPIMHQERRDVVPDLLESSLPRQPFRQIAESECSSQTYYPGTMYFMGLQGQNPPQQDVQLPIPKSANPDSDSDSDHVYDKIPCD